MSNHLAIATVTAALGAVVENALAKDVAGAKLEYGRPSTEDAQDTQPLVKIFLYQAAPNAAQRNRVLPTRNARGNLIEKPQVALDLDYLFSFFGDAATFEPERMLGATARALEQQPLISRSLIETVIADNQPELTGSDLAKAAESVRVRPTLLNLEEMSKLWSVFFQVPYALSVTYQASVVIVEADVTGPPALPVIQPRIAPVPIGGPRIDAIEALAGASFPIVWGGAARLRGQGFGAFGLGLRVGADDVAMAEVTVTADTIELPLTPAAFGGVELTAGLHAVRTVLPPAPGAPAHLERTSGAMPMILRTSLSLPPDAVTASEPPAPAEDPFDGTLSVTFSPQVALDQEVRLFLDERVAEDGASYVLTPEAMEDAAFPATTLSFELAGIQRATYLMRVQVDGVDSAPDLDVDPTSATYRQIIGPEVVIP